MKKQIAIFIGMILLIAAILIPVMLFSKDPEVGTFKLDEYQYYIENFPSEETLGGIADARDATKKAEEVFIRAYGKTVRREKPYQAFYDEQNEVWLVTGTMRGDGFGGVANILMENGTGKVLAVWHDK